MRMACGQNRRIGKDWRFRKRPSVAPTCQRIATRQLRALRRPGDTRACGRIVSTLAPKREVTCMQASNPTTSAVSAGRKPRDDEIDVFGLTHPGKVRDENQDRFPRELESAALRVHQDIQRNSPTGPLQAYMATTLTLWIGVWPRAYLLQVGDSRCYLLRNGELRQLSRDQTLAQDLVDRGVFRRSDTLSSPFSNVLSSALGGPEAAPIVTHMQQEWGNVGLLCSDGLTKHVPDNRIRERLLAMTSAKQVCEDLLRDALDAGGTDNITVLVGRTLRKDPS